MEFLLRIITRMLSINNKKSNGLSQFTPKLLIKKRIPGVNNKKQLCIG